MSEVRSPLEDEIHLSELIETIWRGKWLISGFVAISVIIGFVYFKLAQPEFRVSVPYSVKLYSVSNKELCGRDFKCFEKETQKQVKENLDSNWNIQKNNLVLITQSPLNIKTYREMLDKITQKLTSQIYKEAVFEIAFIKNELNVNLINKDQVAVNMLHATRVIRNIDSGEKAIFFGPTSIEQISAKLPLIFFLSIVLGGIIGIAFVVVNNTNRKEKESTSEV
jgi:hypothetical protein